MAIWGEITPSREIRELAVWPARAEVIAGSCDDNGTASSSVWVWARILPFGRVTAARLKFLVGANCVSREVSLAWSCCWRAAVKPGV